MSKIKKLLACLFVCLTIGGCSYFQHEGKKTCGLQEIASSERQWTGVAVSHEGRIFINYPRWGRNVPFSVCEILPSGESKPFPDFTWNNWNESLSVKNHLVCVQSVVIDKNNDLWIVDSGNPEFKGVLPGSPKLLKVDLNTNSVVQCIFFDSKNVLHDSYLNDVRVDTKRGYAYLSDSGAGAIITVNLVTGEILRRLADSSSTKSEGITLYFNGTPWLLNGKTPQVNVDGIALDDSSEYLYYQALTGKTLYRIPAKWLRDPQMSEKQINSKVERLCVTCAADGIEFGKDGSLYITDLEGYSIKSYIPGSSEVKTVLQNSQLVWPDTIAIGPDGSIYVSISQINLGGKITEPYKIFKIIKE